MRKRRVIAAVAIPASTLTMATACGGASSDKSTLNMLGTGDVDYMDPNISYYSGGYVVLRMWARGLFTYPAIEGKTTTEVPDLATQLPTQANGGISSDGKTVKVTIKTGAKWGTSPARQITAADVVRGVKRTCNPVQPFGGLPDYQNLIAGFAAYCSGITASKAKTASAIASYQNSHTVSGLSVDPSNANTVVFTLNKPATYFVPMLALSAFDPAPKEYDNYVPASAQLAQHTISDGPYKITKYTPAREILLDRNSAWSKSTDDVRGAYVDKIDINETGQQGSIQSQLQANTSSADMEFDTFPPVNAVPGLVAKKDKNLTLGPTLSTNPYLVFNTVSPNNGGALKTAAVRQALTRGINRSDLIQDLGGPTTNPALTHILPKDISGTASDTSINPYPYSKSTSLSALKSAGHSSMNVTILYRSASSASVAIYTTLQQQLKGLGVTVKGLPASNSDFYTKYLQQPEVARRGTWDIAIAGWGPDWYGDAAASFFLPLLYGNNGNAGSAFPPNGSNYGFYNSSTADKLMNQAASASTTSEAEKLWQQADETVTKDAAIYPITDSNQPVYKATHTTNAVFMPYLQQYDPTNVKLSS